MPLGPPVSLPKIHVKKKTIRPSSASANLQSHPTYTSGLFDISIRPSTASINLDSKGPLGQRPHTQATGSRQPWQNRVREQPRLEDNIVKYPRRLTLGPVDGIAESETIVRPGVLHGNTAMQLRSKVSLLSINISFLIFALGTKIIKKYFDNGLL